MQRIALTSPQSHRSGNVLVLSAASLVAVFGFAAFVVDIGFITLTRAELGTVADAAALAATIELPDGFTGTSWNTVTTNAKTAAQATAAANVGGGLNSVYLDTNRDIRFGNHSYDAATGQWVTTWGTAPYNIAEATLHRDQAGSVAGDQPLDLFFAPIIGHNRASVSMTARAALLPAVGIKKIPGKNLGVLPITLDLPSWNALIAGGGSDLYSYNSATGAIAEGSDGVNEVDLYPLSNTTTTAGNRGTVDFGSADNSTADISRQILYGLNDSDLAALGGEINWSKGSFVLNGDTGLSAGIKDELVTIKGQPRMIPLFTSVSGPGNNAMYTITKIVGIRILHVQLTGKSKKVLVQPASIVEPGAVYGPTTVTSGTVFTPGVIVN